MSTRPTLTAYFTETTMIRKMLSLAVEALKVEVSRLFAAWDEADAKEAPPVVALVAEVKAAAVVPIADAWKQTSQGHMERLASTMCTHCGGAKKVGNYWCDERIAKIRATKAAS